MGNVMPIGLCVVCEDPLDFSYAGFCIHCQNAFCWGHCGGWYNGDHTCNICRELEEDEEIENATNNGGI